MPILLAFLSGRYEANLAWASGARIAFTLQPLQSDPRQYGNPAIYVMRAGATDTTRLTDPAGDGEPARPQDGTRIAFKSNDRGAMILVVAADGNNMTRLTASGCNPAWSPDGAKIAFTGRGGEYGKADIFVMNADGTKIAFTSDRNHIPEIFVIDADGTNQTQLTWNPSYGFVSDAHDLSPAWSPFLTQQPQATSSNTRSPFLWTGTMR